MRPRSMSASAFPVLMAGAVAGAERKEALRVVADIGGGIDVVIEQKEAGFQRVPAVRPHQVVLDGGLRIPEEKPETRWIRKS